MKKIHFEILLPFSKKNLEGQKWCDLFFFFLFFSFISPTTTTLLLRTSSTTSIKINQKPNMFKHVSFCEKLRKKLWKIDLNLVKTNPGKVISKGMIDISGHPNIAAAGGGKTRIYKSAGKELSNRFSKASFKVPTLALYPKASFWPVFYLTSSPRFTDTA